MIGRSEILLIIFVLLLLFGAKRIPKAAAALGESLRLFKSSIKGKPDNNIRDVEEIDKDKDKV